MVNFDVERRGDRLIVTLDPGQPIDLADLGASFAALARLYERHYRAKDDDAPKLFVSRLETGSVIAEIRGGSVCLNRFVAISKWFSALIKPLPLRASAG